MASIAAGTLRILEADVDGNRVADDVEDGRAGLRQPAQLFLILRA